jgi:hypothetical protein
MLADVDRHQRLIFGVSCPKTTNEDKDTAQLDMALQVLAHGRGSDNRDEDESNGGYELRLSLMRTSILQLQSFFSLRYLALSHDHEHNN